LFRIHEFVALRSEKQRTKAPFKDKYFEKRYFFARAAETRNERWCLNHVIVTFARHNPLYAIVIAAISIISGVYIFNVIIRPPRIPLQKPACINNLRQLDGAKQQWALERSLTNGTAPVIYEINQYVKGQQRPICPQGGSYTYGNVGELPRCTIAEHNRMMNSAAARR
jgi:hypothetical protein